MPSRSGELLLCYPLEEIYRTKISGRVWKGNAEEILLWFMVVQTGRKRVYSALMTFDLN